MAHLQQWQKLSFQLVNLDRRGVVNLIRPDLVNLDWRSLVRLLRRWVVNYTGFCTIKRICKFCYANKANKAK